MNGIRASLMCCLLFAATMLQAGLNEDYVWVYSLIQQGEDFERSGRDAQALATYLNARNQLTQIKRAHPEWNPKVVDFRLRFLEAKIAALMPPESAVAEVNGASSDPEHATATSPNVEALNAELLELQQSLEHLRSDNNLLQAKLREALSVHPAAVDPGELEKAEGQNRALMKEVEVLRSELAEAQSSSESPADTAALEKLRDLSQENAFLKQQLDQVRRTPTVQDESASEGRLNEVVTELALLQSEVDILQLEKSALEIRMQDIRNRSTVSSVSTSPELAESRARLAEVEQERAQLQRQLARANQDLANVNLTSIGEPNGLAQAEIERLEARLAVYEAEKIPYSVEELVLFRMSRGQESSSTAKLTPPSGVGPLVAQAESQFQKGDFEQAEVTLREMLKEDDSNALTLANLAATQIEQGKEAEAEANLRKALESAPHDPFTLATMGVLKFLQEDYEEALDYLGLAAQYDPEDPVVQFYLGTTLSEQGMRGPAETALRRAIQLKPDYADAHYNLALIYALQDPPLRELARWHYQKALSSGHPRDTEIEQLLDRVPAN